MIVWFNVNKYFYVVMNVWFNVKKYFCMININIIYVFF